MNPEPISVITYDFPHRKTQDVIFGLKTKGYKNVVLLALPFVERKKTFKPIYQHRPGDAYPIYPEFLASNFGYNSIRVTAEEIASHLTKISSKATLIAGAGLLPAELVNNHPIINSHPAYLPEVRGLDALKWAIHKMRTVGVTTHFVDEKADAGSLIDRKAVPIFSNDTIHSVAYRQYRLEIEMLIEAVEVSSEKTSFSKLEDIGEVHRRMPKAIEQNLLSDFEKYKNRFALP